MSESVHSSGAVADLIGAAGSGDVAAVRAAIAAKVDVDGTNETGQTALIVATLARRLDIVRILLDAGADPNLKDDTVQSAYLLATCDVGNDPALVELLLERGGDVRSLDSWNGTGLIRAAERGHYRIVDVLLGTDIEVDHINRIGYTAMHEAVLFGDGDPAHQRTIASLVRAGADRTIADGKGRTALESARAAGFDDVVAILEK